MIWIIIGLGLPIAMLIFLVGWLSGYQYSEATWNWGTGYDAGWEDRERVFAAKIAERYNSEEEEE